MIKYLIMDVDGTLTDGKIYIGPSGETMKAFSVKDGYVFKYILNPNEIIPVVITARTSSIVQHRCGELGIEQLYQGKLNKADTMKTVIGKENLGLCAYFGDDVLDLECMNLIKKAGGIVGCPSDAVMEVKAAADYVCVSKAGEGALREFSEWLVKPQINEQKIRQRVENALAHLLQQDISQADIGKKIVVSDDFFYTIQSYATKPVQECKFESHKQYVDIQIMLQGTERMDLADTSRLMILEDYDEDKDIMFWRPPFRMVSTTLSSGDYVILYPENAHRGAVSVQQKCEVVKIVGKVRCR